jgi:hypothetical protein
MGNSVSTKLQKVRFSVTCICRYDHMAWGPTLYDIRPNYQLKKSHFIWASDKDFNVPSHVNVGQAVGELVDIYKIVETPVIWCVAPKFWKIKMWVCLEWGVHVHSLLQPVEEHSAGELKEKGEGLLAGMAEDKGGPLSRLGVSSYFQRCLAL